MHNAVLFHRGINAVAAMHIFYYIIDVCSFVLIPSTIVVIIMTVIVIVILPFAVH